MPRTGSRAPRRRPNATPVTSPDSAARARAEAKLERLKRILRGKHGVPPEARALLGINTDKLGRLPRVVTDLAELYINMTTAPPHRPLYPRKDALPEILEDAAAWVDYQGGRGHRPQQHPEPWFVPDCDAPMSAQDALRNVAAYAGVGRRQAWELLDRASSERERQGLPALDLPKRPNPRRRNSGV